MKHAWRPPAVVMIVSVLAVSGCSSTQPDRIETRTSSLGLGATALVDVYDCYEVWQDQSNPPDGTPDVKISDSLECFPALENGLPMRAIRAVPWRYSLKITVVPAGGVGEVLVTSLTGALGSSVEPGDTIDDFESLTDYDPDMPPVPIKIVGDTYYLNGHRVSSGSPIYLANLGVDPGLPNILETAPTFDFNLNTGDTVVIRARKQPVVDGPPGIPTYPDLKISAVLGIAGVPVAPKGSSTSSVEDSAGFTFSFTVQ